jgi:hypothetical protein
MVENDRFETSGIGEECGDYKYWCFIDEKG